MMQIFQEMPNALETVWTVCRLTQVTPLVLPKVSSSVPQCEWRFTEIVVWKEDEGVFLLRGPTHDVCYYKTHTMDDVHVCSLVIIIN